MVTHGSATWPVICVVILAISACGKSTTEPSSGGSNSSSGGNGSNPPSTGPAVTDADLTFCISETNRYRAMKGRPALSRSTALESFGADSTRIDQQANSPHQHFLSNNGGGISLAENEQTAATSNSITTQSAMASMLSFFYSEGPSGPHYLNMMAGYTQAGCGVYRTADVMTIAEEFR